MKRMISACILLGSLLCGCGRDATTVPVCRVVTQIRVTAAGEGAYLQRTVTQAAELSTVLNYLRQLEPRVRVSIQPDSFRATAYTIDVTYSDGSSRVYRQIHDEYLQTDSGPWRKIDPRQGKILPALVQSLTP